MIDIQISWKNCFNSSCDTSFFSRCVLMKIVLLVISFFMQIDLKMSDLLYYRQSVFIVFILLATYQLPVLLVKPSSGVGKFPLIFWKLPLISFIECIPYLAEPSSRVSKVASVFWQLPYCRGMRVRSLSIASMKDIDCKILVTANFTVYLQFLKLCQNDQVISFGTNRKVKFHCLKMIFALKV